MKIVPQFFFQEDRIRKIMVDGLSGVVVKRVEEADHNNDRYLASHALTLVLKGSLQVEQVDGDLTIVPAGRMIFLPRGLYMISDIIPKGGSFEAAVFFFEQSLVDQFVSSLVPGKQAGGNETPIIFDYDQKLRLFTENLLALYGEGHPAQKELTRPKLMELLHLLSQTQQGPAFQQLLHSLQFRVKRSLREFMQLNFHKPLSVADYAYLSGRSLSTFHRDFKRQFGLAPKKWLIEQRLERARQLLQDRNGTVQEVALFSGYDNPAHFIKAFKKRWGITPKQWAMREG